jgi:hypothetical protein
VACYRLNFTFTLYSQYRLHLNELASPQLRGSGSNYGLKKTIKSSRFYKVMWSQRVVSGISERDNHRHWNLEVVTIYMLEPDDFYSIHQKKKLCQENGMRNGTIWIKYWPGVSTSTEDKTRQFWQLRWIRTYYILGIKRISISIKIKHAIKNI